MKRLKSLKVLLVATLIGGCGQLTNSEIAHNEIHYLGEPSPGMTPKRFAPGLVSTDNLEIGGVFSPNMEEFYFIRQIPDEEVESKVIRYLDGEWQAAVPADDVGFISPSGERMYLGNEFRERTPSGWSEKKSLGPPFDAIPIMRLTSSASGTYVFDERDEIGTLRYSRIVDGLREAPKPFNEDINSGKWTAHPYIAVDESYLIWDSERSGGYGSTDLYISFRQEDGSWGPAINMGEDINSPYEDGGGRLSPDGKYFFFDRINLDELVADIYWVEAEIIETLRPE